MLGRRPCHGVKGVWRGGSGRLRRGAFELRHVTEGATCRKGVAGRRGGDSECKGTVAGPGLAQSK